MSQNYLSIRSKCEKSSISVVRHNFFNMLNNFQMLLEEYVELSMPTNSKHKAD